MCCCRLGWECLGDAYLQRGGYIAALKAFTRAAQVRVVVPVYTMQFAVKLCICWFAARQDITLLYVQVLDPCIAPFSVFVTVKPLCRIAAIRQAIGMLTGAVEEFELILKQDPNYVPALKGVNCVDVVTVYMWYVGAICTCMPFFRCS